MHLLLSLALAACPLPAVSTVEVHSGGIDINGIRYRPDSLSAAAMACGYGDSVAALESWRTYRRRAGITAGVGMFCFSPAILATPVYAVLAYRERDDVRAALLREGGP